MFLARILAVFLFAFCFINLASGATRLPADEVAALREIGETLGKKDWNFDADPCGGEASGWIFKNVNPKDSFANNVTCNCTFLNGTVCHVTNILLKAQSLPGTLPPQVVNLPFLEELDLTRNYLSGSIPPEWGSTKLVKISLLGNRLTGSIPEQIGNISTLTDLVLEINHFSGSLPPTLGNLTSLLRLLLTSNNFSGELPPSLARMISLLDFRISDNNFSGPIPTFIGNWTNLGKVAIQASGLSGPIPSEIGLLTKLTDLRISDLKGASSPFPPLNTLTKLKVLILRNCNITGVLPNNSGGIPATALKGLDFSFNKITGKIPASFEAFKNVDSIYLTGNLLNGSVPTWMLQQGENTDISYNKFTWGNGQNTACQSRNLNLFASSSQDNASNAIVSCLAGTACTQIRYSLHINCGGRDELINGKTRFEADQNTGKPSLFFPSATNWAFSNTGNFMDDDRSTDDYIALNVSTLSMPNHELYTRARISPISLTYYAYCMGNGNYTVSLHFAEIAFTNDKTFSSLGRRIFDVYIQGKLELKDFNIADAAGGAGKPVVKKFAVSVTNSILEIRFFWAGKGTTAIPTRGVYGPLISAISVDPDFVPPSEGGNAISAGAVIGIVAAVAFVIFLVLGVLWWRGCLRKKSTLEQELKGLELATGSFSLRQIKAATNNFDAVNKIGEGGFGPVYKGVLGDGTVIAVKQLSSKSKQGNREFVNEIGMISALQHPHLVKLYGCCIEGNQLLLVYEYLENNSLARALFGPEDSQIRLDWPTRQKICVGIARGLAYLHEESRLKIVHRDIKATNVLLDKNLNSKISDFGLAKLDEEENTHISTRVAGTFGYMAPEYAMRGYLTDKADVYSFGIVALEIVSGRGNTSYRTKDDCFYLLDHANILKEKDSLIELVDPRLGSDFNKREVMAMINVALQCTNIITGDRPAMSSVVSMLEGKTAVKEVVSDPSVSKQDMNAMWSQIYRQKGEQASGESQTQSMSIDGPWTSSTTASDLYPINMDSKYLENRN